MNEYPPGWSEEVFVMKKVTKYCTMDICHLSLSEKFHEKSCKSQAKRIQDGKNNQEKRQ